MCLIHSPFATVLNRCLNMKGMSLVTLTNYQVVIEQWQGLHQRLVRWTDACFLGAFVNLQKDTISFIASFRPHGITWLHWTEFDEILYLSFFSKTSGESSCSINMWHDVFILPMLPMDRTLWFNSTPVKRSWVTPTFFYVLRSTKTKRFAATSLRYSVLFKETGSDNGGRPWWRKRDIPL
jgi:hypothetical protein